MLGVYTIIVQHGAEELEVCTVHCMVPNPIVPYLIGGYALCFVHPGLRAWRGSLEREHKAAWLKRTEAGFENQLEKNSTVHCVVSFSKA